MCNQNEKWSGRVLKDWVRQQVLEEGQLLANLTEELCGLAVSLIPPATVAPNWIRSL